MTDIRLATGGDLEAVYGICLQSADQGNDATHLYEDPKMIGHIYAAPYLALCADTSFVAVEGHRVLGYLVGAADTVAYEQQLEGDWWPNLRDRYADPDPSSAEQWSVDQRRAHFFHHPVKTPSVITTDYPAHIHMNLAGDARGKGIGPRLLETWMNLVKDFGVTGVHVGTNPHNPGAFKFWSRNGFVPVNDRLGLASDRTVWLGRSL